MKKLIILLLVLSSFQSFPQCWDKIAVGTHHTMAILQDGTLWSWGNNSHLQQGQGSASGFIAPNQVGTDSNWAKIYAGELGSFGIKTDGTLWGWGANYDGQVGNGTEEGVFFPVQIGTNADWDSVSYMYGHTAAIKTDGSLWTWGDNSYYQLGNGTAVSYFAPQQVGTDTNWKMVRAGLYNTFAIKTDGTLWVWGVNAGGSFGIGLSPQEGYYASTPEQIGTDTDWATISVAGNFVAALKTDGTLWTWGQNDNGQLGDGTIISSFIPHQIGSDTWLMVSCGKGEGSSFCVGLKPDGTVWAWGDNIQGQLGNGSIVSVHTPFQVGTDSDWLFCEAGAAFTAGLKADNALQVWGSNMYGQFGNGTYNSTPFTSPSYTTCNFLSIPYSTTSLLSVYPNPATNIININIPGNNILTVKLSDLTGKVVLTAQKTASININSVEAGMYILFVATKERTYTQKVIIK